MNSERLSGVHLPIAPYRTVMALADKGRLTDCARRLDIPVPASQWYRCSSELVAATLSYPLVLKPCLSKIYTQGRWIATRVRILRSSEDLSSELLAAPCLHDHRVMLQEFTLGLGAGVFCLYDRVQTV